MRSTKKLFSSHPDIVRVASSLFGTRGASATHLSEGFTYTIPKPPSEFKSISERPISTSSPHHPSFTNQRQSNTPTPHHASIHTHPSITLQQQALAKSPTERKLSLRDSIDNVPTNSASESVSIKAQLIFDGCWKKIESKFKESYVCPREVIWLNGAPGSGKGTNIPWIMKIRGLSRAVGMSQLLDSSPEMRTLIDRGELVPDAMVLDSLLDAVLNPDLNDGAGLVIDGFPRTATQVDFVKLLYDKLMDLHMNAADGPDEWRFPRPSFKVVILYVDEEESMRRQTKRAELASLHNQRVLDAGTGDVWNVRTTDISEALCRRRYQVFKAHYNTILRLKSYFPFSLIDAMGTLEECRAQIVRELRYQSSLDLDERTYAAIRHLPLARDLVRVARQRLVFRLDSYCKRHHKLFTDVIALIDAEVLPLLKQCSLAGHAEFNSRHPLLLQNTLAVDMLIDVLTDRGFSVAHSAGERIVPKRVDLATGEIETSIEEVHSFRITFDKENVRDLSTPASVTTKDGEDVAIGTTIVPEHLKRENSKRRIEEIPIDQHHGLKRATSMNKMNRSKNDGNGGMKKHSGGGGGHDTTASSHSNNKNTIKRRDSSSNNNIHNNIHNNNNTTIKRRDSSREINPEIMEAFEHLRREQQQLEQEQQRQDHAHALAESNAERNADNRVEFLKGWDSMDVDLNTFGRNREYGYELMNERED